ncbi:MAG: hypothetical protein ACYDB8_13520, partial [Acidiferrobacterales bacterium]
GILFGFIWDADNNNTGGIGRAGFSGCVSSDPAYCAGEGYGSMGPGSATATFFNGALIELQAEVHANALASYGNSASASVTVDPFYLDLPAGATFSSYSTIPGFLSNPAPVPLPRSLFLLGSGLLGLLVVARRRQRG